jgi:hypothetical protein
MRLFLALFTFLSLSVRAYGFIIIEPFVGGSTGDHTQELGTGSREGDLQEGFFGGMAAIKVFSVFLGAQYKVGHGPYTTKTNTYEQSRDGSFSSQSLSYIAGLYLNGSGLPSRIYGGYITDQVHDVKSLGRYTGGSGLKLGLSYIFWSSLIFSFEYEQSTYKAFRATGETVCYDLPYTYQNQKNGTLDVNKLSVMISIPFSLGIDTMTSQSSE